MLAASDMQACNLYAFCSTKAMRAHARFVLCGVQALIFQGDVIRFLTVALLIVFIVLESVHKLVRQHSRADFIASAVIGGICSALLFAQGIYLVHILRQVRKLHKQWYVNLLKRC